MSSSLAYKSVTHCIFDMDGLLIDSETIYEDSVRKICESYNKEYPRDVRIRVMGTTQFDTAEIIINELSLPLTVAEFLKKVENLMGEKLKTVKLMKGAERLIHHLHQHNIQFCLATSSAKESAEMKMSIYPDLFKLFSHFVMASTDPEVKHGKPAPDIFLIAADRFKDTPDPNKCLVFEDSPNGVQAGASAGMQVVMVPDDIIPQEKRAKATIVLKSLENFQPELFGLPKFTN